MKPRDIAALRLRNQRIADGKPESPGEVVAWLGAVQAQEFPYAKWSLGKRMTDATEERVDRAFADGEILRTHALRPTWHFLTPADLRWIQQLTAPRVHAFNARVVREHELDELLPRCRAIIENALAGGNCRTRRELQAELARHGIEAAGQRLAYIVMNAELEAVICSGPLRGRQHTYALVEERAPRGIALAGEEALAELTRRYFRSHGPATVRDYAWWSSFTMAQARAGIASLANELEELSVDGRTYWYVDSGVDAAERRPTAHLMQAYDEYIIAYTESRDVLLPERGGGSATPPPFMHALLIDGRLAGHWRRSAHPERLVVEIQTYYKPSAREWRAVQAAVERYRVFSGAVEAEVRGI